jgi:hypothetical protein
VYNDRKNQKCLPQEYIDKIFHGPYSRWDNPTDINKSRVVVKQKFKQIKEQMFEDDPNCPENNSANN